MPARANRWIILVVVPILLALYVSYPPTGMTRRIVQVTEHVAATAEEAEEHGVAKDEVYKTDTKVLSTRFLPLSLTEQDVLPRARVDDRGNPSLRVYEQTTVARGRVNLGLDIAGGAELLYRLKPRPGETLSGHEVTQSIDVLKKRIDPANIKEYRIRAVGEDRIMIAVPRATAAEIARLKARLQQMGELQFRLAPLRPASREQDPEVYDLYRKAEAGENLKGTRYYRDYLPGDKPGERGEMLLVGNKVELTGRYLARVYPTRDSKWRRPAVGFEFDTIGSRKFADLTSTHQGWLLAIILDGQLQSAPRIRERIAGAGIIEGRFTEKEVLDLVNILRAGSLPMDIELLQENTVGPELGRDSIRKGLLALAVAGFLVLVFIGVYYSACGLVADAALIMNLVLLVGVLCLLGAALTLPGMAGILLTVGMAVDANVLIFERIREESAAGKALRVALRNGYDRAFTTIVDANVTTLLTAIILYMVGTGPVKGFAITLSVGILISMFTALLVTRLAFETFIEKGWMTRFKMRSLVRRPSIAFSAIRKPAYMASALVVVVGLAAFFARGSSLYDIDFTGGWLMHISLDKPVPVAELRARLAENGFPDAEVLGIRTAEVGGEEGLIDLSVRIKGAGVKRIRETVLPEVRGKLEKANLLGEGDSLFAAADARTLVLSTAEPIFEMDLRRALAAGDSPYDLGVDVTTVVPTERESYTAADESEAWREMTTRRLTVRERDQTARVGPLYWHKLINAVRLALVGEEGALELRHYRVVSCRLSEDARPALNLELDEQLQWELLATELVRSGYAGFSVEPTDGPSTMFTITGPADELAAFRELKAPRPARKRTLSIAPEQGGEAGPLDELGAGPAEYTVERCDFSEEEPAALNLLLDRPVLPAALVAALKDQLGFPDLEVEGGDEPSATLSLTGEHEDLQRFRKAYAPVAAEFFRIENVPEAQIDGPAVSISLRDAFTERGIRARLERYGLEDVYIVPLDRPSREYELSLSAERVRDTMRNKIFKDEARASVGVSFERKEAGRYIMRLDRQVTLEDLKGYVANAAIGAHADGLIVGEEDISAEETSAEWPLSIEEESAEEVQGKLARAFRDPIGKVRQMGSVVAEEMKGRALLAIIFASVIIVFYVAARFHAFRFGVAAVIALIHDVAITAGLIALADSSGLFGDLKISLATLAAFLTIIGYSLNDTIVVFDRIRENMNILGRRCVDAEVIDLSINQTLSRTVLTSLTTLMVVVVLYLMAGPVLQALAFTLIVGVVVGTYSSMFIASPILLDWQPLMGGTRWFFRALFLPVRLPFRLLGVVTRGGKG